MQSKTRKKKRASKKSGGLTGKRAQEKARKVWQDEERENMETLEFIKAVDRYKRKTQKAFPSWTEVLKIIKSLGYRKVDG